MAKIYDVIYMDACVILDCLSRTKYFAHVEPVLVDAEAEKLSIVASTLCFTEVIMIKDDPQGAAKIDTFFNKEYVVVYDVDDQIAKKAGAIRVNARKLETADAIHLATAIVKGARVFLTRDGDGERGKKGNMETILELRGTLNHEIEIMTPEEFFKHISSAAKQMEIKPDEEPSSQENS